MYRDSVQSRVLRPTKRNAPQILINRDRAALEQKSVDKRSYVRLSLSFSSARACNYHRLQLQRESKLISRVGERIAPFVLIVARMIDC